MNAGCAGKNCEIQGTRALSERFRGVFTTSWYTNPHLPLPYLWLSSLLVYGLHVCYCVEMITVA